MGDVGEQPSREVLPADRPRTPTLDSESAQWLRLSAAVTRVLQEIVNPCRLRSGQPAERHMLKSAIAIWHRLRAIVLRRRLDRDLDDEIAFHLGMREADYRTGGASRATKPGSPPGATSATSRR